MRALILLLAVVLLLALFGWISFSRAPGHSSVNIETERIRADTNKAVQSGADLLHQASDKLKTETAPQTEQAPPPQQEATPVVR
jgi:hypothetical protein